MTYGGLVQGTMGLGSGKASELAAAVQKANMRALKNLFYVPMYLGKTIHQRRVAKYGRNKVIMYPRSAGQGIIASPMITAICHLVGIRDIGVKVGLAFLWGKSKTAARMMSGGW